MPILITIVIFGVVVLIHEIGHFVAARRCGVLVEEFAIGMGPKLIGRQIGETLYTIRLIPIGGFCKMHGDDADVTADRKKNDGENSQDDGISQYEEDNDTRYYDETPESSRSYNTEVTGDFLPNNDAEIKPNRSFYTKSIPKRMIIMAAGSIMNFLLAFVLFATVAGFEGFGTTTIAHVNEGMPAEAGGLASGDRITSINGTRVYIFNDIRFELDSSAGRPMEIGYVRNGQNHRTTVTPIYTNRGYMIGFGAQLRGGIFNEMPEGIYNASIVEAARQGFFQIRFFIRANVLTITRLVTRQAGTDQIMGPIGIVGFVQDQYQTATEVAAREDVDSALVRRQLLLNLLGFCAAISASLGIINLLPLPALDGGRLVFLILEAIRRKPLPPEREGMVHLTGFVLLMILGVFIAYQDIMRMV